MFMKMCRRSLGTTAVECFVLNEPLFIVIPKCILEGQSQRSTHVVSAERAKLSVFFFGTLVLFHEQIDYTPMRYELFPCGYPCTHT